MPDFGEVLHYRDFEFEDGTKRDKLLIILSSACLDNPCLFLLATSQSERFQDATPGCNPSKKVFFIPASWKTLFPVDTYIPLLQILEKATVDLLKGRFAERIFPIGHLREDVSSLLLKCLRQFRDDISDQHWNIIFPDT